MLPLIIRASAGTGKTYRLSLEFINLLLKYRVGFDEILVITFTKKATAEIRERIFEQLAEIISGSEKGRQLISYLQSRINHKLKFDSKELAFLQNVQEKMLTSKSAVCINTIDSFVNTIFSSIIAPYHNLTDFTIDNTINRDILPEIFEVVLQNEKLAIYQDIFLNARRRNLDSFHKFVLDIIENRWLFEFMDISSFDDEKIEIQAEHAWIKYLQSLDKFLSLFQNQINIAKNPDFLIFNADFRDAVSANLDPKRFRSDNIADELKKILSNTEFIEERYSCLLFVDYFWNRKKIKNTELEEHFIPVQDNLAEYLYFAKALDEQWKIISLAGEILQKYDEIKFRDRIFTHSDISYYTFRYLYDPRMSIVERGNILNLFYEQLSYKTRFVLIDEFQDTSILQWSIFYPLLKEIVSGYGQRDYGGVIVVGDEKQAIYGWRGGERQLLTDFEAILAEPVDFDSLTTSFRSKPILMNWINRLFGSAHLNFLEDWEYTNLDCNEQDGGFVQVDIQNSYQGKEKLEKEDIYRQFVENILLPNLQESKINPANSAILMRKNEELKAMASILDEVGISYSIETTGSLFSHQAVKPILFVLNFLVYEDIYDLLKFLRSDLILMKPAEMKEVIRNFQNSTDLDDFLQKCDFHPCFQKLLLLRKPQFSLLNLVKTIMESFGLLNVFNTEIEIKNVQRFLEVVAEFENSNHDYSVDLSGLLQYICSLSQKEEYSQIGQSISDSLKLITIHKAKGLQFETVFSVMDVTGRSSINSGLYLYYQFSDDFRQLQDFALTLNYDKVLRKSPKKNLLDRSRNRDSSNELNNIYVALTRARNNLFLYLHFTKKGGLEEFLDEIKEDDSVPKKITKTIHKEFYDNFYEISSDHHQFVTGSVSRYEKQTEQTIEDFELPDFFGIDDLQNVREDEEPNLQQLRSEYLMNNSFQIGIIAHDYLSHILFDMPGERKQAKMRTITNFGSLIPLFELEKIFQKLDTFIEQNSDIFQSGNWDKVFTEYSVFDQSGNEYRIDRLLINTKKKQVLIIDFKTGLFHEQMQLKKYESLMSEMAIVKRENYAINSQFREILL